MFAIEDHLTFHGHKPDVAACVHFEDHRHCATCETTIAIERTGGRYSEFAVPKTEGGTCAKCLSLVCPSCLIDGLCRACDDEAHGLGEAVASVVMAMSQLRDRVNHADNNGVGLAGFVGDLRRDISQIRAVLSQIEAVYGEGA